MKYKTALFLLVVFSLNLNQANAIELSEIMNAGLPVVIVETENALDPTCDLIDAPAGCNGHGITNANKVPGHMRIEFDGGILYDSGDYEKDISGLTIKVRGNTSAWYDKKPYKIKLQKKADLLFRGSDNVYKDKEWLLIKDDSLRAMLGFKINELIGMQWTPQYMYVNLVLNGDYKGMYLLVESVKRNKDCRINIEESGYIFEFDAYWWNESYYLESPLHLYPSMNYTLKYPDPDKMTSDDFYLFKSQIERFEYSFTDDTYEGVIDLESFVNWILGHDILGSGDPCGANIFVTKFDSTDESKIRMGNLWDFDRVMEMNDDWSREHLRGIFCYKYLIGTDFETDIFINTKFQNLYIERFDEINGMLFDNVVSFLDEFSNSETYKGVSLSMQYDNTRWGTNHVSAKDNIKKMIDWVNRRKIWMRERIDNMRLINSLSSPNRVQQGSITYRIDDIKGVNSYNGITIQNGHKYVKRRR